MGLNKRREKRDYRQYAYAQFRTCDNPANGKSIERARRIPQTHTCARAERRERINRAICKMFDRLPAERRHGRDSSDDRLRAGKMFLAIKVLIRTRVRIWNTFARAFVAACARCRSSFTFLISRYDAHVHATTEGRRRRRSEKG